MSIKRSAVKTRAPDCAACTTLASLDHTLGESVARSIDGRFPAGGPLPLEFISNLSRGRAAEVNLVRESGTGRLYAEKLFRPSRSLAETGRNLIYWLCFQAPFPYQTKRHAIQAAMLRRNVLRDLTEFWFGSSLIADAFYVRWDEAAQGHVLGTEYVKGRGPRPEAFDAHVIRNFLLDYLIRYLKRLFGIKSPRIEKRRSEMDEVTAQLDELKRRFHQSGFTGSEWQVDKMLSVTTSNLLRDENGQWILVDAESGMPALVLIKYIWQAIKTSSFPLFDDVDFGRLNRYLEDNLPELVEKLGAERICVLYSNIELLQYHTTAWKSSETAIFRNKHHVLTDGQLRASIKSSFAEQWLRTGQISTGRATKIMQSDLFFAGYLGLGLVKSAGLGIYIFGRSVVRFFTRLFEALGFTLSLLYSAFFNECYLKRFAESYVNDAIEDWKSSQRLTDKEAALLKPDMNSTAVVEYLKGFMVHIALKPIGTYIIIGFFAYVLRDPELEKLAAATIVLFLVGPSLRTLYTLYRMVKTRGKGVPHGTALMIGALPKVGNVAYAIQMSAAHPNLSSFLSRWMFSNFGRRFPLFGGTDSRLEHFFIKLADVSASLQYELVDFINGLKSIPFLLSRSFRRMPSRKRA